METMLQGAGRVIRLWAEGLLADAVVLAVYARPGGGHYCSLWTTDPITAVTAGRLRVQIRHEQAGTSSRPLGLRRQLLVFLTVTTTVSFPVVSQHLYSLG